MLALSAIAVTAVSCSDDDKPTPAEQNQLVGKWNYIDYNFSDNSNECNPDTFNGTWNVTGNTFKLALGEGEDLEDSFEIKKLTAETFEIQRPLTRDEAKDYELNVVALKFIFKK